MAGTSTASGQPDDIFFLGQKLASVVDRKISSPTRYPDKVTFGIDIKRQQHPACLPTAGVSCALTSLFSMADAPSCPGCQVNSISRPWCKAETTRVAGDRVWGNQAKGTDPTAKGNPGAERKEEKPHELLHPDQGPGWLQQMFFPETPDQATNLKKVMLAHNANLRF